MKFQQEKILTISFGHFINDIYTSFLSTLLPKLIDKLGISHGLGGVLFFVMRFPNAFNFLIGIWATRIKSRFLVIISPALTCVGMSLVGLAPSYSIVILILFTVGLSNAMFHVPAPVMIRKIAGDRVGRGMSFYMVGGELARTLGPLLIGGAVSLYGLEGTYRLIPLGVLASVWLYFKLRNIDIHNEIPENRSNKDFVITFRKHLKFFLIIIGYVIFRSLIKSSLVFFLPTYMNPDGSESIWVGGIPLAVLELAGVIGTFLVGNLSDKVSKTNLLIALSVLTPVVMFWFSVNEVEWLQYPILLILGFLVFAPAPVLLSVVQQTGSEHPEFINGLYMTINFLSGSLAVLLVGFVSDLVTLNVTYIAVAIAGIGAVPFTVLLKRYKFPA